MNHRAGTVADAGELADRVAIADVFALHSRGLDRLDAAMIRAAYWPDAEVDYGSFKGSAHQFAELVVGALADQYELTRHCIGNTLVEFSGERAHAESLVTAAHLLKGAAEEMLFYGRYLDRLEKRHGQWKMMHRQVVMDWSQRIAVADERGGAAFAAMAKSAHGDADPLAPFLATIRAQGGRR